jgi:endonuclease/exonuclease/phosphatase family metal-dependent hydrolase
MRGSGWTRTLRVGVAITIVGAAVLAAPSASGADGGGDRDVRVMTQNLYLGASLDDAVAAGIAGNQTAFVTAVNRIYHTVAVTDFPTRAKTIADEIAAERPDMIGLQEVTTWTVTRNDGGEAPEPINFLDILQKELAQRGLNYTDKAISDNADLPAPLVDAGLRCAPPTTAVPPCVLRLQDRDVILVNQDAPKLDVTGSDNGNFTAQATVSLLGQPLSFDRCWAYIDGSFQGDSFRFVTTHLEVANPAPFDQIQEEQARELVAGPLKTLRPVILVGDLNSAADGSTTDSYFTILKALFADAWWTNFGKHGFTCCQDELLNNPKSKLTSRIDYVLTRRALPTSAQRLLGEIAKSAVPHWASDHAGVVATIRLF